MGNDFIRFSALWDFSLHSSLLFNGNFKGQFIENRFFHLKGASFNVSLNPSFLRFSMDTFMYVLKVFIQTPLILFYFIFPILILNPLFCMGAENGSSKPLSKKEISERLFKWWAEEATTYSKPANQEITIKGISWIGDFDGDEKEEILSFIKNSEFGVFPFFKVLKMDLENDGKSDYLMSQLFVKKPKPDHYGSAFAVLNRKQGKLHLEILSLSNYPGIRRGVLFTVQDLNGDGFKEVIIGWEDYLSETDSSPMSLENTIYKHKKGTWRPIYERATYDYLKISDLDKNGIPEILETVDDSKEQRYKPFYTKWRWINVYNLIGPRMAQTNHQYLKFYKEKKKEYEALKKQAMEKEKEAQKRGDLCPGCKHSAYFYIENIMDEYIERIDKMIEADSKNN